MVTRVTRPKPASQHPPQDAVSASRGLNGERMSKVDTAWLRMDSDSNLMMIVGVWVIQPAIPLAVLRERLETRLLKYPRFTQCVLEDAAGASWVNDADFSMDHHLVVEKLAKKPKGREQEALQDRLSELTMQPLDRAHPLWQFHLVEHYRGGSALLVRIHHCIADGIALIAVRVVLHRQFAIGLFDLFFRCAFADAQNFVIVAFGHVSLLPGYNRKAALNPDWRSTRHLCAALVCQLSLF